MKQTPHAGAGKTTAIVRELAAPVMEEYRLLLWDVRFVKEGTDWFLRVYIDREEASVSIDDCVNVSRRLSDLLDEADPIPQSYCLEVSSPGIERELTRPEHFARFIGAPVAVRLYQPRNGVREYIGTLEQRDVNGTVSVREATGALLVFERREISGVHLLEHIESEYI